MKKNIKTNFKFLAISLALTSLVLSPFFTNTIFAADDDKIVILHTNSGPLVIEFFPDDAPFTIKNFLQLTESGFYDRTLFHRIIKDFMIQGGDPLTQSNEITGERGIVQAWGTGDAGYTISAEFNAIKHNRGIISMARSADPDSASSQFFIVHKDANHLDQQYTAFGRLLTSESFTTLDKLANLSTTSRDLPNDFDLAEIIKTEIITRAEVKNPLNQGEPDRLVLEITDEASEELPSTSERFTQTEYDFSVSPPPRWTLLYPEPGSTADDPVITFYAPNLHVSGAGQFAPFIFINVNELGEHTFAEHLDSRIADYRDKDEEKNFEMLSDVIKNITNERGDKYGAFVMVAKQQAMNGWVKFEQTIISHGDFVYGITYANHEGLFNDELPKYRDVLDSFHRLSTGSTSNVIDQMQDMEDKRIQAIAEKMAKEAEELEAQGGGCLIATAAFGSEMAPQVQFLREIRDNTVLQTESGTSFMAGFNQFYYSFSPAIADYERENPAFKEIIKLTLTPLLTSLTLLQFVEIDSESDMLAYGIGIILLNIGMYFVTPAALIIWIRNFHKLQ